MTKINRLQPKDSRVFYAVFLFHFFLRFCTCSAPINIHVRALRMVALHCLKCLCFVFDTIHVPMDVNVAGCFASYFVAWQTKKKTREKWMSHSLAHCTRSNRFNFWILINAIEIDTISLTSPCLHSERLDRSNVLPVCIALKCTHHTKETLSVQQRLTARPPACQTHSLRRHSSLPSNMDVVLRSLSVSKTCKYFILFSTLNPICLVPEDVPDNK